MAAPAVADITHVIQLSVAPVFMLTAVGTIIAALSIRLGRATDRRRALEREIFLAVSAPRHVPVHARAPARD